MDARQHRSTLSLDDSASPLWFHVTAQSGALRDEEPYTIAQCENRISTTASVTVSPIDGSATDEEPDLADQFHQRTQLGSAVTYRTAVECLLMITSGDVMLEAGDMSATTSMY